MERDKPQLAEVQQVEPNEVEGPVDVASYAKLLNHFRRVTKTDSLSVQMVIDLWKISSGEYPPKGIEQPHS